MEEKRMDLTDEIKEKLKGFLGFQSDSNFTYVPKVYRKKNAEGEFDISKDYWPIFDLKSKNGLELAKVEDSIGDMRVDAKTEQTYMSVKPGAARITTLEKGIKEVRNFMLNDGSVVSWAKEVLTINGVDQKHRDIKTLIKLFPIKLQTELQNVINERSELSIEELEGLELSPA